MNNIKQEEIFTDNIDEEEYTLQDCIDDLNNKKNIIKKDNKDIPGTWEYEAEQKRINELNIKKNKIKKVKKNIKLQDNFDKNINNINENLLKDYENFDIVIECNNNQLKRQNNHLDLNEMSIKELLTTDITDTIYDKPIYITTEIYDNFDLFNEDLDKYELILFINLIHSCGEQYDLIDDEDIHIKKNIKKFYLNEFQTYFNNKYKDNTVFINEMNRNIKKFNYHYDKIYPVSILKNDNPTEYNRLKKNKSNLKTQYRKYLEGHDINTLKNIPALKMMIYIIESVNI